VDLSPAALEVARANAVRHGVGDRIAFLCGDGFAPLPAEARFNLIVANPPYIPAAGIEALQPEVRDHDPRLALDGGPDGLAFMRRLANEAPARLAAAGRLMVEFGDGQAEAVAGLFAATGWQVEPAVRDWNDRPRMVVAWRE
jgi:release factor glutamine methyltransferase